MSEIISIIPQPVSLQRTEGFFSLSESILIVASGEAHRVAAFFVNSISPATGFSLPISPAPADQAKPAIHFILDPTMTLAMGKEGYQLSVAPQKVTLIAPEPAGLFYGVQSLRQLLPPEIFSTTHKDNVEWLIPCVEIQDRPRFPWRGAMLDVGRYFMPKIFILKFIDLLALHKLNTLHWHLTDDQGWRIEIIKYPRLTQVGAWRTETLVGHLGENEENSVYDGILHGGFYTQTDIREVVAYAKDRFINVVPEIEMPGHAQAAIAAYPQLGNTAQPIEVSRKWGIHEDVFNVNENTLSFLKDVLAEVMDLFPSQFIHVGGDEVPKKQWQQSPAAQSRMKELGLTNEEELQSYFMKQMDDYLAEHGRRLLGWDEILEGGLAPGAAVMSWRGEDGGIAAANSGHDVIMTPCFYTYLDYYQTKDTAHEPLAIGGYLTLEIAYSYEPVADGIAQDQVHHILGTQAQLWTEYMPDQSRVEYMAFPRLCALAEVAWTPSSQKDLPGFSGRLQTHFQRLDRLGVNFRKQKDL
jgi:hexosaminidase